VSKYYQYGVEILKRLQDEATVVNGTLIWTGSITPLIREIAGASGNVSSMKKRLLEYGVIRGTSEEREWEVADYDPAIWNYESHRVAVARRPLTKIELRDEMLDRLTQNMNEIRIALNALVLQNKEVLEVIDGIRQAAITDSQITFEEYLHELACDEDARGVADRSLPTGDNGLRDGGAMDPAP
jgi:hypothetical protein